MSEFQYYEFYSIDKELTKQERKEIDGLSSRFSPTSRRAVYTYSYGDFKHNEESVLLKYFDFFLYISNWGTKRLMYKLPQELVSHEEIKRYICSDNDHYSDNGIKIYKKSKFIIIDINISDDEGGYWVEEDNNLSSDLIGLRQDILDGDYRALFIMWLHVNKLEHEEIDEEMEIPKQMIPDNLKNITAKLECLMTFFEVDVDWVLGASKFSNDTNSNEKDYLELIKKLPLEKKDEYLAKLIERELNLSLKLKKELDNMAGVSTKHPSGSITFKELLSAVKNQKAKRMKNENSEIEKKRIEKLKIIDKNRVAILKEIDYHIIRGTAKSYDEALLRMLDLKELALYKNEENEFKEWIQELKKEITRKSSMLKRIEHAGL